MPGATTSRVQDYLGDLDIALAHLPAQRRHEIVREIAAHIDAALADAGGSSPATIDAVLDRLGPPSEIAAAADEDLPPARAPSRTRDVITVVLLLAGGVVVPFLGWLIGVVLLWTSTTWRRRDQLIGTLLIPGGLLAAVLLGMSAVGTRTVGCASQAVPATPTKTQAAARAVTHCTTAGNALPTWSGITLIAVLIAVPAWTAWWLLRQLRQHHHPVW